MALFLFLASFGHKPAFLRKRRLLLYKHGGTTVKNQKGAYTMQNCQDNFYTTFGSFLQIQDYHRQQTKASQWRKCKINDLCVEPLSTTSPLMGNLSAFAAGTITFFSPACFNPRTNGKTPVTLLNAPSNDSSPIKA